MNREPLMDAGNGAGPAPGQGTKLSHVAVHYTIAKVGGPRCADCEYYQGSSQCRLVASPIYPAGVCDKFEARDGQQAEQAEAAQMPSRVPMAPGAQLAGQAMAHGRAIAGAKALHAVGHIDQDERDRHMKASQAIIRAAVGAKRV